MDTSEVTKPSPPPIWGVETCDSCGVRAHVMYYREALILTFCKHHASKYRSDLLAKEWEVTDIE